MRKGGVDIRKIFWGMLFVFLNFNLDLDASRIGLIPTFIGYILLMSGTAELRDYSDHIVKIRPYIGVMVAFSGLLYILDLLGVTPSLSWGLSFILGLISTIMALVISYNIVMSVLDIEAGRKQRMNFDKLFSTWKFFAVCSVIIYLLFWFPALAIVCIIANLIAVIVFLEQLNRAKNMFY